MAIASAVVQPVPAPHGRADYQHRGQPGAFLDDPAHGCFRRVDHRALEMQVVDRVAGDAQLGIDRQIDPRLGTASCWASLGSGAGGARGCGPVSTTPPRPLTIPRGMYNDYLKYLKS